MRWNSKENNEKKKFVEEKKKKKIKEAAKSKTSRLMSNVFLGP
jgi:hypothetical protein